MDITTLFKARLDIVRNRNKALGTMNICSPDPASAGVLQTANGEVKGKSKLFSRKKTEYYAKARELVGNISSLREFLIETRAPYLNVDGSSMNLSSHSEVPPPMSTRARSNSFSLLRWNLHSTESMTDSEKDQIDMTVQKVIQNNQKRIFEFQKLIDSKEMEQDNPQLQIHLGNVINSVTAYLKEVCTVYGEMKAIRVKRSYDFQNISKINSNSSITQHNHDFSRKRSRDNFNFTKSGTAGDHSDRPTPSSPSPLFSEDMDHFSSMFSADNDYTAEELQILEEENSILLQSLNTVADEVEQIESSVVQIAQLQEIFTEKVLLQDKDITQISNVVIGTTENIKGGNEQLRQAIQQNADFRAWILFFLIVMSLSLLFLDCYGGHIPTMRYRFGASFGRLGHDILEDPCVAQAPRPVLRPPMCPRISSETQMQCCSIPQQPPCFPTCDPRAHHLNRSPYCCPCRPEPDTEIYRCCESLPSSYAGHVPGFTAHSTGRTTGLATWGTKQYMNNCMVNDVYSGGF